MTLKPPSVDFLDEDLLDRIAARAADYDATNRFFTDDLDDLAAAGYLTLTVPVAHGGLGASLPEACEEQRRLARAAPATALGVTMHLYWGGVATDLGRAGDRSLGWILEQMVAGEVFAVGRGERGSDLPLVAPVTRAVRVAGGYLFEGHKIFNSMSPAWTRLAIEGLDADHPAGPRVVHAFLERTAASCSVVPTWDTLGMRATRSDDLLLAGAFVPDSRVARLVPAGWSGVDQFVLGVSAWAQLMIASVYLGIADRALELAVASCCSRTSATLDGRTLAHHPMLQHTVAEMAMAVQGAEAVLQQSARDWSTGVDHGRTWIARLAGAKHIAVEAAKRVVDLALDVSGGAGMFKGNELERLYRDVRCGGFHPPNPALTHEIVGKTALGVLNTEAAMK